MSHRFNVRTFFVLKIKKLIVFASFLATNKAKIKNKCLHITTVKNLDIFLKCYKIIIPPIVKKYGQKYIVPSGGYSNLGARGKTFQKLMLLRKKRGLILACIFFSETHGVF